MKNKRLIDPELGSGLAVVAFYVIVLFTVIALINSI